MYEPTKSRGVFDICVVHAEDTTKTAHHVAPTILVKSGRQTQNICRITQSTIGQGGCHNLRWLTRLWLKLSEYWNYRDNGNDPTVK